MIDRVKGTFRPRNPNGIFILGEYAEVSDQRRGYHFSGGSGQELRRMCSEAGFNFYDCYHDMVFSIPGQKSFKPESFCNDWGKKTTHIKPRLEEHRQIVIKAIEASGCNLVIALGDLALYALTGEKSVAKWRGSCLTATVGSRTVKVIPSYAPSNILKVWNWRWITVHDLRRAYHESDSYRYAVPRYNFIVQPTFEQALETLSGLLGRLATSREPVPLAHDVETLSRNISCSGFAWSSRDAICIPFMTREEGRGGNHNYWTVVEEFILVQIQIQILTHPNARIIGQNYLYDMQHLAKSWGIKPNVYMDTMLAWHTIFPGEKKSLDFLASMFCDYYVYWKDELKDYNTYPLDQEQYWRYNCTDCVYTFEVYEHLEELLASSGQGEQYSFQMDMYMPAFRAMLRGVRIDQKLRRQLSAQLLDVALELEQRLLRMTGDLHPPGSTAKTYWFNSAQQSAWFFYTYLGQRRNWNRKTGGLTCEDDALKLIAEREPILQPVCRTISELRSVNIFRKNFIDAPLGKDGRIRCSYNLAGTETFRLASSKDAFGQGANLQTIPSGTED